MKALIGVGVCEPQWEVQLHSREKRLSGLRVWNNAFFISSFFFLISSFFFLTHAETRLEISEGSGGLVGGWG